MNTVEAKTTINCNIDNLNVKNDFKHLKKALEETVSKLRESEKTKIGLEKRNSLLIADNKALYGRLLAAEKGRILAEKEVFELEKKLIAYSNIVEDGAQISDKVMTLDSSTSTIPLIEPVDICENCGTTKVMTCAPADAIVLSREDVNMLDANMSLLKEVLVRKEKMCNEIIENDFAAQNTVKKLNKQILTLQCQNRWKNFALAEKERQLQANKTEAELMKRSLEKLKYLQTSKL
ncbi:uncharacterized protein [Rhodnius prolixus]